jgi:DNA-binding transcriptional LysR family regulator
MGPRQLRSFIAVAEELHFGRAAKLVNLSQPALSLQISGMEDELQVKLFVRNRRKTELTQAGEVFLQEARDVLQRTEQAITTVRRAALGQVGTLRIGFISTAAAVITPPLVKQFRERYTHVELDLRNVLTRDQLIQLQERCRPLPKFAPASSIASPSCFCCPPVIRLPRIRTSNFPTASTPTG